MKKTITDLAKHTDRSRQSFHQMKKANPKLYEIVMKGWEKFCEEQRTDTKGKR